MMPSYPTHLAEKQAWVEGEMRDGGVARYRKQLAFQEKHCPEDMVAPRLVAQQYLEPLAAKLKELIKKSQTEGRGRIANNVQALYAISPDVAAYLTLRTLFARAALGSDQVAVARAIGAAVEAEVRYQSFSRSSKQARTFLRITANQERKKKRPGKDIAAKIRTSMKRSQWASEEWSKSLTIQVGHALLSLGVEVTGLFELVKDDTDPTHTPIRVQLTAEAREWLKGLDDKRALLHPDYLPCVVPPKPWKGPVGGGYYASWLRPVKLVKGRNWNYHEELRHRPSMSFVYQQLNALQNTAWKINTPVMEVLRDFWANGQTDGGLPASPSNPPEPPCPGWKDDPLMRKDFRRVMGKWHQAQRRDGSKRVQIASTIVTAGKYREDTFHFPYNLDFRGRIYSLCSGLNPQGHDVSRGLLYFANKKPIEDTEQLEWLMIHGANCYGVDKVPFKDRVAWVEEHTEEILRSAEDPHGFRWWCDADSPWQFLAFCFEWKAFQDIGLGFESGLPVGVDGSCNGLQHFSALLRDPIGGAATNLTPGDRPADIYQEVADKVLKMLAGNDDPLAKGWLRMGITRKTTKRCVMTLPYGATRHAFGDFIDDYLCDLRLAGKEVVFGDPTQWWGASRFLANAIGDAISETVVAAVEAMKWLQEAARIATDAGYPIQWDAPTGFPVHQDYRKTKKLRILSHDLLGKSAWLQAQDETEDLDRRRQVNAIAPNFVHSLDASALLFTVDQASQFGIESYGMIHDSYATVAADVPTMGACLRAAFVGMHSMPLLAQFRDGLESYLGQGTLPAIPGNGNLDLNLVLQSPYFFS